MTTEWAHCSKCHEPMLRDPVTGVWAHSRDHVTDTESDCGGAPLPDELGGEA